MSIIYTLIARNTNVIMVEQNTALGNFPQIARSILTRVQTNTRKSYTYND